MDILAARKKAAERAKAAQAEGPKEQAEPAPAPAFPPLPDTTFVSDDAVSDASLMPDVPAAAAEPEVREAAPVQPEPGPAPFAAPAPAPADAEHAADRPSDAAAMLPSAAQNAGVLQEREQEMLSFLIGAEEYIVPVDQVQEVLTPREVTPVPHTPGHILGVCSLRGAVLPIVDLHRRLGLGVAAQDERSRIVVVHLGDDDTVGLTVDRVRGVVRILPSSVRPVPETVEQGAELLLGIARKDERLLILLDVEKAVGLAAQAR